MKIGIPKETKPGESRVAATPDSIKRLTGKIKGLTFLVESGAGGGAYFPDEAYTEVGAQIVDRAAAFGTDVVLKVNRPDDNEISLLKKGNVLVCHMEPHVQDGQFQKLAGAGVETMALELVPRISRAQSMDALSSQANIAGYRAVIEAMRLYGRFFPIMMTAAGTAKPARVIVLGAGVAGLQAIATAKRMGAVVEAYDVRPEVKEQIESLGGKFIELDVGEKGSGEGGYAKELSEEGKKKQQQLLTEKLKTADVIITTAQIPGRPAPVLVTEEAVKGMKPGSVIVDMAAASGGNCPLTEADKITTKHGVQLVGITNLPSLLPAESSNFLSRNLINLISLFIQAEEPPTVKLDLEDEIIAGALATHKGQVRYSRS